MAPSTMFSYLHGIRSNGRKASGSPTTASTQPSPTTRYHSSPPLPSLPSENSFDSSQRRMSEYDSFTSSSPVSPGPPVLPPIPRVASRHESHIFGNEGSDTLSRAAGPSTYSSQGQTLSQTSPGLADPFPPNISEIEERQHPEPISGLRRPSATQESFMRERPKMQYRPHTSLGNQTRSYSEPQLTHPPFPRPGISNKSPKESSHYAAQSQPSQTPTSSTNHIRSSKTKLNLLNPMSLLAKRRSPQTPPQALPETHISSRNMPVPGMRLPDDYDPRIRGKMVHDFSAPRPKHNFSYNDATALSPDAQRPQALQQRESSNIDEPSRRSDHNRQSGYSDSLGADEDSPASVEKEHTPVFKEHFGDDVEPWQSDQGLLIKQPASIYMSHLSVADPGHDPSSLPAFARNLPIDVSSESRIAPTRAPPLPPTNLFKQPLPVVEESGVSNPSSNHSSRLSLPPLSPPETRSPATSNTDPTFQPAGLPKHLPSNASRFSFDMAGVGSATQEKLLEEKHRQKAAQDAAKATSSPLEDHDNDEDESDFDYIDDDGFEEGIPGVNTDADDEETNDTAEPSGGFHFASPAKSTLYSPTSPVSTAITSMTTPRDSGGQPIGFALTKVSPDLSQQQHSSISKHSLEDRGVADLSSRNESSLSGVNVLEGTPMPSLEPHKQLPPSGAVEYEDDDLYFDDGMIDDMDEEHGQTFDESVFDDETSRVYSIPIRDLKSLPPVDESRIPKDVHQPLHHSQLSALDTAVDPRNPESPNIIEPSTPNVFADHTAHRESIIDHQHPKPSSYDHKAGLTQNNLAAYHDALALAANQAAINGKFARKQSLGDSVGNPLDDEMFPGMTADNGRVSNETAGFPADGNRQGTEDFDFDDALEDDPIIAAANAEALENDDEGFYGQEFGFFAHASSSGEAEYANGGYFGSRGADGIGRSHSGRVNFQEPSLTPITERSEWSNRTSMISLAMYGHPHSAQPQPVSSPGLAQLADMMQYEDDNMSLSALMKLRRGAWGGSNGSLRSSTGSQQSGSPLTHFSPLTQGGPLGPGANINASHHAGSNYSLASIDSADDSPPSSPTITTIPTLQTPDLRITTTGPSTQAERSSGSESSPKRRNALFGKGHSRNSSGASESVSYVKETDQDGVGRWWLEKRRVGEGGEVEILGRRVVEGGRI